MNTPRIDLQEGHKGRVKGATGAPGEMAYNDYMGDAIKAKLLALSTKPLDIHIHPAEFPGGIKGNVFLALHCDGSSNANTRGFSIGYPGTNKALATAIEHEYAAATKLPFKGYNYTVNESKYYGFGHGMWDGEALIEFGFRSNKADREYMDTHKDFIAETVARAILRFLSIPVKTPAPKKEDKPMATEYQRFSDVPKSHWAFDAIEMVAKAGIMIGSPNSAFQPDRPVTRAQVAVIAARLLEKKG